MDYKSAFMESLDRENKDECIQLSLEALEKSIYTIPTFYEEVLKEALYLVDECSDEDCIWREHVRTSIVRSVIECLYPHVINLKKQAVSANKKVVLACPEKEYHEIGLRMIDDFFNILGYKTIFVGTNTPKNQVLSAVLRMRPDYLAVSVTDYYLLFETQKMIQNVKSVFKDLKIIVGGIAFKGNFSSIEKIGGDIYLETFQDLIQLRNGEENEIVL